MRDDCPLIRCYADNEGNCNYDECPLQDLGPAKPIQELSTVAKFIKLLEDSAAELKKNPYAMERIMGEIDTFCGIETGRLERPECEVEHCDDDSCPTHGREASREE